MKLSRRELSLLLPALAAGQSAAQKAALPSKTFRFEDLAARQNGPNRSWAILNGETHNGFAVELHQTELAPGRAPHPPHHHVHEELLIIREGTLEVTLSGNTATFGPGSVVYVASNDPHGWRNTGTVPARYFVMALGRD